MSAIPTWRSPPASTTQTSLPPRGCHSHLVDARQHVETIWRTRDEIEAGGAGRKTISLATHVSSGPPEAGGIRRSDPGPFPRHPGTCRGIEVVLNEINGLPKPHVPALKRATDTASRRTERSLGEAW